MNKEDLKKVYGGGFSLSVTFFNAISRYIVTIKGMGEAIGSSIRRIIKRKFC